eukprot:gnl/TRDRNA2_/TRDRNA2_35679_c0_seq1.p1 gnl/TRDRNA2_/TRDRNA2_35679_c0~~gnl/TRDRNA2_/TRDRNA2_35679_c0_seq1.p1  ORF type:complete len:252 (-),score=34.41 gnl/TRDRNA2_/TRDRNA2_35679_c0_seq1:89-844(-)
MKLLQYACLIAGTLIAFVQGARLSQSQANSSSAIRWGPNASQWPVPNAWPATYYGFAPAVVVDLCGGYAGSTTWSEISPQCGQWVLQQQKCFQVCFQTNRVAGFGKCMHTCGGAPETSWCSQPFTAKKFIKRYCKEFIGRWKACQVSEYMWATPEEYFESVDKCVFVCETSLETEMALKSKYTLTWRKSKCKPDVFACDARTAKCVQGVQESTCVPPLGLGSSKCFFDDPGCGPGCKKPASLLARTRLAPA